MKMLDRVRVMSKTRECGEEVLYDRATCRSKWGKKITVYKNDFYYLFACNENV